MEDDKALIAELTELALSTAAPDELVVFEETAEEYFADPQAALTAAGKDSAVGFGLELAMITPVALAVGSAVVQAILTALGDRVYQMGRQGVGNLMRRLLRRGSQPIHGQGSEISLSPDQARFVRQVALDRARSLGMPEGQAIMLADSFVGAIVVNG
ncbi:MAG TPA: hypothetical protein VFC19_12835 [Candidatus Limnocylindrales bacterium]|nr:hypothetical protein [Candidatus Limnocylindrales bacterium]